MKEMRQYEAPEMEIVDAEMDGFLCASFNPGQGGWEDAPEMEEDI